jgi:hypothetical protein
MAAGVLPPGTKIAILRASLHATTEPGLVGWLLMSRQSLQLKSWLLCSVCLLRISIVTMAGWQIFLILYSTLGENQKDRLMALLSQFDDQVV